MARISPPSGSSIPLPKSLQSSYRQSVAQQEAIRTAQSQQTNQLTGSSESDSIAQLKNQYGPKVGFEIYQYLQYQKELEAIKDKPGMGKKEAQLRLSIATAQRAIKSAGISQGTAVGKKSGKNSFSQTGKESISQPLTIGGEAVVGGYSSISGESVFITQSGKEVKQVPASFEKPKFSAETIKFSPDVPKGSLSSGFMGISETAQFEKFEKPKPSKETSPLYSKEILSKETTPSPQKVSQSQVFNEYSIFRQKTKPFQRESTYQNILGESQRFTEATDYLTKEAGKFVGRGLTPKYTISKMNGMITLVPRSQQRLEEAQLGATRVLGIGQYLIPIYGEIKGGTDILTEINRGEYEKLGASTLIGAGSFVLFKGLGKGLSSARGKIVALEASKLEKAGIASYTAESSASVKIYDKLIRGAELTLPVGIASIEVSRFEEQRSQLPTRGLEYLQTEALIESRAIPGMGLGYRSAEKVSAISRETLLRLQGKSLVEYKEIADPLVLAGEKTFPEFKGPAKDLVKEFRKDIGPFKGSGGFTATRSQFKPEFEVGAGKSETPGIYISPKVSEFFLRLNNTGQSKGYSLYPNLLDEAGSPLISRLKISVYDLPPSIAREYYKVPGVLRKPARGQSSQQRLADIRFLGQKPGKAIISPQFKLGQKVEAEAIVLPGTKFSLKEFRYYTKIKGEAVPIKVFRVSKEIGKGITSNEFSKSVSSGERYFSRKQPVIVSSPIKSRSSVSNRIYSVSPSVSRLSDGSRVQSSYLVRASRYPSISRRPLPRDSFRPDTYRINPNEYRLPSTREPRSSFSYANSYYTPSRISRSPPRTIYSPTPRVSSQPIVFSKKNPTISGSPSSRVFRPGFLVGLVKKYKVVSLASRKVFTREEAIAIGASAVDRPIGRTFTLIPTAQYAPVRGIKGPTNILRLSKRSPRFFVEKSRYAISTGLEKGTLRQARRKQLSLLNTKNLLGRFSA